jgi:hypothetical protein
MEQRMAALGRVRNSGTLLDGAAVGDDLLYGVHGPSTVA